MLFLLILISDASFHDFFTSGRISHLQNRNENIKKDIFVDTMVLGALGGMKTLTENVLLKIATKRENWRFIICRRKGSNICQNLNKLHNVKFIETKPLFPLHQIITFIEEISSGIVRDKIVQLFMYNNIVFDQHVNLIFDPAGEWNQTNSTIVPKVSTIHDLAWFEPNGKNFLLRYELLKDFRRYVIEKTAKTSKKIITVSNFSKRRILEEFHLPADKVKAIPIQLGKRILAKHSHEKEKEILKKHNIRKGEYFIFCSSWWGNKNHKNLMLAFEKFMKKNSSVMLFIVGWHQQLDEYDFWNKINEDTKKRIVITDFLPNDELSLTLQNALAFIHPSVYEGCGIPLVEAMASGIPVACSNVASLPEVVGDAAILFDPYNIDEIASAMLTLANDKKLRHTLIQKGYKQVKQYNDIDAMIDQYIKVMEENMT